MRDVAAELRTYYDREIPERAARPLTDERRLASDRFAAQLRERRTTSVLEVGCGGGRDGLAIAAAGVAYTGCDLSPVAVQTCRALGLEVYEASATALPFADDEFDAGWSMSTLMHLPGDGFSRALGELRRVVRSGGFVEIGVWGADVDREWDGDPHGRYFLNRSDATLRRELELLGRVEEFDTWAYLDGGGHYQWARVIVG